MKQQKIKKEYLVDRVFECARKGLKRHLEEQLDAGFPIEYKDENGDWVRKNPDRTIDIIRKGNRWPDTEKTRELSPETTAWLDRIAAAHNRMSMDEEYRKEVTKKAW